jgi:nicotinate phosphoribosyltransferase
MKYPIITSLLDQDLYKFTMAQLAYHQYPNLKVKYAFKCRNTFNLVPLLDQVRDQVKYLCTLRFTEEELNYLKTLPYIKQDFIDYLRTFKLNYDGVTITENDITFEGTWLEKIFFEIFVLSIVNEIASGTLYHIQENLINAEEIVKSKMYCIAEYPEFKFSDFGTRRRFSKTWQANVLQLILQYGAKNFVGTSNVDFARRFNIKPIGTMAHEYLMVFQALTNLADFQKLALQVWLDEYRGQLGIALTDVVGMDAFLRDFDRTLAKYYSGVRHDSGDPFIWTRKLLNHYDKLGIDSKGKTAVYSDSLTFPKALDILQEFKNDINILFGIGTNLTNDIPGWTPLNVVMKLIEVDGQPVAKISDSPGKEMCRNQEYIDKIKTVFNIN